MGADRCLLPSDLSGRCPISQPKWHEMARALLGAIIRLNLDTIYKKDIGMLWTVWEDSLIVTFGTFKKHKDAVDRFIRNYGEHCRVIWNKADAALVMSTPPERFIECLAASTRLVNGSQLGRTVFHAPARKGLRQYLRSLFLPTCEAMKTPISLDEIAKPSRRITTEIERTNADSMLTEKALASCLYEGDTYEVRVASISEAPLAIPKKLACVPTIPIPIKPVYLYLDPELRQYFHFLKSH